MTTGKRLGSLWILLAIQILAAIWLWWPHPSGAATGQPWLALTPGTVTRIALTDGSSGEPATLTLQKQDGMWRLPDADDFPADAAKVKHLLHAVAGLRSTLPVAVTHAAAKRFHVARHQYQTRVTLDAGKRQLARFYVGNSAGADRVYLRRADSHVVEANMLPSWLVSPHASDWRDHAILHLANDKVTKLVLPEVTLVRQKGGWTAASGATPLDKAKVHSLVQKVTRLDFTDVTGAKAGHPLHPTFTASVDSDGKALTYDFAPTPAKPGKPGTQQTETTWQLTRSDLPYVFTVSDQTIKALQGASIKSLAATPKPKQKQKGRPQQD